MANFQKNFVIEKYIAKQTDVSKSMRAILVNWMVEVQVGHSYSAVVLNFR